MSIIGQEICQIAPEIFPLTKVLFDILDVGISEVMGVVSVELKENMKWLILVDVHYVFGEEGKAVNHIIRHFFCQLIPTGDTGGDGNYLAPRHFYLL